MAGELNQVENTLITRFRTLSARDQREEVRKQITFSSPIRGIMLTQIDSKFIREWRIVFDEEASALL